MPQKHVVPGSNPGWGTRFFRASECARACSFTTWMWQRRPRRAADRPASMLDAPRGGVAWFPSSNGQDRGPSSRVCRFKSGRERQYSARCSAAASARRSGRRDRRFDSCRRDQRFPCSSVDQRARGYGPRGRGFESLPGCQSMAPYLRRKSPRLSSGRSRVQVPPAPPIFRRVAQQRESSRLLTGRLQVQLLPRRPTQCSVSSVAERLSHTQEVDGSLPSPSTNTLLKLIW